MDKPTYEQVKQAMITLKDAGCDSDVRMDIAGRPVVVIYVELHKLPAPDSVPTLAQDSD
jgi:hypothetical protein